MTQMTLVFIRKGLVLEGWPWKIESVGFQVYIPNSMGVMLEVDCQWFMNATGKTSRNVRRGKPFWKNFPIQSSAPPQGEPWPQASAKTVWGSKMVMCQQSGSMLGEAWETFWRKAFKFFGRTFFRTVWKPRTDPPRELCAVLRRNLY